MSASKLLARRTEEMRKELNSESVERLYDPYPPGYDPGKKAHVEAWLSVLPNFPFQGQLWSKDRYKLGLLNGRHVVGQVGDSGITWLSDPFPPQEETADRVTWDDELTAEWRNLARKLGHRPAWWTPSQKPYPNGYVLI